MAIDDLGNRFAFRIVWFSCSVHFAIAACHIAPCIFPFFIRYIATVDGWLTRLFLYLISVLIFIAIWALGLGLIGRFISNDLQQILSIGLHFILEMIDDYSRPYKVIIKMNKNTTQMNTNPHGWRVFICDFPILFKIYKFNDYNIAIWSSIRKWFTAQCNGTNNNKWEAWRWWIWMTAHFTTDLPDFVQHTIQCRMAPRSLAAACRDPKITQSNSNC